jgi:hypothetical protein
MKEGGCMIPALMYEKYKAKNLHDSEIVSSIRNLWYIFYGAQPHPKPLIRK